jgi:2-polyprenyl-3-methyl-5-hydroxy-6-metoxy-1,4-benzoquinol methylase
MAQEDKERWDEKWQNNPMTDEPIKLVSDYASLAPGQQALDIACGRGRHSKYLASKGFEVDALDISSVAIEQLQNIPHIHAKEVDFDTYTLPKEKYDLIVCTYFLERRLFPQMIDALKPNGIIIMETFLHHPDNERTTSNPAFLPIQLFFLMKVNLKPLLMTVVNFYRYLNFGMRTTKDTKQ